MDRRLDKEKLDEVVEKVVMRLSKPRVGLLCTEALSSSVSPLPASERFIWVPYTRDGLASLERPEEEGLFLSVLAVPTCSRELASELLGGFPLSSEGWLVFGCLGHGVPVLLDGAPFARLGGWRGSRFGDSLLSRLRLLSSWGVSLLFPGGEPAGTSGCVGESGILDCPDPLVTWRELDGKLDGIVSLRIERGARLTQEASERLERLGVNIIRRV